MGKPTTDDLVNSDVGTSGTLPVKELKKVSETSETLPIITAQEPKSTEHHGDERERDSESGSVRDLGRYRSFLRLQALGIAPQFKARLEPSDIVQQTLLEAHEKLDQFRGSSEAEMANWLNQMLSHNIADAMRALRRKKRDIAREQPLENVAGSSLQGAADWIAAEQTSPSLRAFKAEQFLQLSEAISQLPPAQQEVIVLHHLQGQSLSEVAAHMQRSTSAVAGLLYRGLRSLRELLT